MTISLNISVAENGVLMWTTTKHGSNSAYLDADLSKRPRLADMKAETMYQDLWSAELYHAQHPSGGDDLVLWRDLARITGGPVLELACGTGRAMLPLARDGYNTVGLDISRSMLTVGRRILEDEPAPVQRRIHFVKGNMARFALRQHFGLIFVTAHSFHALLTPDEQRSCLRRCHRHLKPRGLLAIDLSNAFPGLRNSSQALNASEAGYACSNGEIIKQTEYVAYDASNQNCSWRLRYKCSQRNGTIKIREQIATLHYFRPAEMDSMLRSTGFKIQALYGSFDKTLFEPESPEMIFVARKVS